MEIKLQCEHVVNEGLKRNHRMIDDEELNLSPNVLTVTADDELAADFKLKKLYIPLKVKWNIINDQSSDYIVSEFEESACSAGDECKALRRMVFIADIFKEYCLKPLVFVQGKNEVDVGSAVYIELFTKCLSGYSAISFLDDLQHIEAMHDNAQHVVKCGLNESEKEVVSILMRKYRARERSKTMENAKTDDETTAFVEYMNGLDDTGRAIIEMSVKMIDAIFHRPVGTITDGDGGKEEEDEKEFKVRSLNWWKEREPIDQKNNKFMNEVTVKKEQNHKTQRGRIDKLKETMLMLYPGATVLVHKEYAAEEEDEITVRPGDYVFIVEEPDSDGWTLVQGKSGGGYVPSGCLQSLFRVECGRFLQYLICNEYDSDAVLYDLVDVDDDPCNEYKDSNLFHVLNGNQFLAKTIKKHLGSNHNDDDELSPFTFGSTEWKYWPFFKTWRSYNKPKYRNLKEECTSNNICVLSMKQFMDIVTKATLYRESQKGRRCKAMDHSGTNSDHCIPSNLPITVSHIMVLLMYCNWTELQYLYKKIGCRKTDENQSEGHFKANNAEIGHWYRLIHESVEFFGTMVSPNNIFYTGLNLKLGFATFSPEWLCPFSTTTSHEIATRFSKETGIILKLTPAAGSLDSYFNVEWLSNYRDEKERLFVRAFDLQIIDIQYVEGNHWTKNEKYLSAFTLFSTLFDGHFLSTKGRRKTERFLLKLIRIHRLNNGIGGHQEVNEYIPISLYVQQLFYNLLQGFKTKMEEEDAFIIRSEFETLSDSLKSELFLFKDENDGAESFKQSTLTLTPFMSTLCKADDIVFTQEYIWIIYDERFNELQNSPSDHDVYSEEEYQFKGEVSVSFKLIIRRKSGGQNTTGFGIKIKDCSNAKITGSMSVFLEMNTGETWNYNRFYLNNLGVGGVAGIGTGFDDNLLDTAQSMSIRVAIQFA